MSNTTTKTWRLGGAAGYSVHGVQALTEGKPTYRRSLGLAQTHPVYTRVELWKDAEDEANVLCSLRFSHLAACVHVRRRREVSVRFGSHGIRAKGFVVSLHFFDQERVLVRRKPPRHAYPPSQSSA